MEKVFIIISIIIALILLLIIGFILLQGLSSPALAKFSSPANPKLEVWLLEEGFQDRGLYLFVKSPEKEPLFIGKLDWTGLHAFSYLQWSKDGQVIIATVQLPNGKQFISFAHDFSTRQTLSPPWESRVTSSERPDEDWINLQSNILNLITLHGGAAPDHIGYAQFQDKSRNIPEFMSPNQ